MASLIQKVIQVLDRQPQPPKPQYSIKAQLERSLIFEGMAEKQAKLETFRTQEIEFRAMLAAAYGTLAYEAERARYKVETRDWKDGDSLATPIEHMQKALDAHTNCTQEITYLELSIADDQQELDDAQLWIGVL